jgi:hypothetical protein
MKIEHHPTTTYINGFILKVMDIKTATISKKKFITFVLLGMFERVVTDHGIDEETLATMKNLR